MILQNKCQLCPFSASNPAVPPHCMQSKSQHTPVSYDAYLIWKHTHTIKYFLSKSLMSSYTGQLDLHWLHQLLLQSSLPSSCCVCLLQEKLIFYAHIVDSRSFLKSLLKCPLLNEVYIWFLSNIQGVNPYFFEDFAGNRNGVRVARSFNETGVIIFLKPENCNTLKENYRLTSCMKIDIKNSKTVFHSKFQLWVKNMHNVKFISRMPRMVQHKNSY